MTWDKVTDVRIAKLHPAIRENAEQFINEVEKIGIKLRVTQGLRTIQEQNDLYAIGRTIPGKKVTNAVGGKSYHNYGLAIDVCQIDGRMADFDPDWLKIVPIAEKYGFAWGGKFKTIIDKPHFEKTFGHSTSDLFKQNKTYPDL